jgi:alkanesulfonate monooxygenase SsuD/methylene tetrahydromethanopterin reductase-like flavin-dependent oxidoreductase (luciferase family)
MTVMFGVHCPPEGLTFTQMRNTCLAAEEQGYDLFTMTDHFYPMRPESLGYPLDCWSTLAGLATITTKIKLGSLVSCVWYRHPTVLGKIATTIDIISNGRLILGIGAGWHEAEFNSYFGHFPSVKERSDALQEAAQILSSMLHGRETNFRGKLYCVDQLINTPSPIQQPIPLLIGGGGEKRTLRTAAMYGDISHLAGVRDDPAIVEQKIHVLKTHCDAVGRNFSEITLGLNLTPAFEDESFIPQFLDCLEMCLGLGVQIISLRFYRLRKKVNEVQKRFAEDILPSYG